MTRYSANAPCRGGIEINSRFGQILLRPFVHAGHAPHETSGLTVTLFPAFLPSIIKPAAS